MEVFRAMPRRANPDPACSVVGYRIRQLRQTRGLLLEQLALAAQTSKGHLSSIEHGLVKARGVTIDRIARALEVVPAVLFVPRKKKIPPTERLELRQWLRRAQDPVETRTARRSRWRRERSERDQLEQRSLRA
jgi:transcriptional regulator with XRE-family HTH domain